MCTPPLGAMPVKVAEAEEDEDPVGNPAEADICYIVGACVDIRYLVYDM